MSAAEDHVPKLIVGEPPPEPGALLASALAEQNPIGILLAVLTGSGEQAKAALSALLRSLVEEGSRFAVTPSGQRWAGILAHSPAVERGWLLWSQTNIDTLLQNAAPLSDAPAALLETALTQLATLNTTEVISQLSRFAADIQAEEFATRSRQS